MSNIERNEVTKPGDQLQDALSGYAISIANMARLPNRIKPRDRRRAMDDLEYWSGRLSKHLSNTIQQAEKAMSDIERLEEALEENKWIVYPMLDLDRQPTGKWGVRKFDSQLILGSGDSPFEAVQEASKQ